MRATLPPAGLEGLLIGACALVLFAATTSPWVQLGDDGLFVLACSAFGPAHPPGYPLFVAAGGIAVRILPVGPVLAVHLVSALFGALAVGLVPAIGARLGLARPGRCASAGLLAVSPGLWGQSLLAEVYSLHVLLLLALLLALLRLRDRPDDRGTVLVGVLFGASLANHWPLTLLCLPALAPLWPWRRTPLVAAAALPSALLPYLWLWWRSVADPQVSFLGPLPHLRDLLRFVGRSWYARGPVERGGTEADRLAFLHHAWSEALAQVTPLGFAVAAGGLALLWTRERRIALVLGGVVLLHVLVLPLRLLDRAGSLEQLVYEPWPLVGYAALVLLAGVALDQRPRVGLPLGAALIGWLLVQGWPAGDRAWADRYATTVLTIPAAGALLVTAGDTDTGPLAVHQRLLGTRPDLRIAVADGTVLAPRLADPWTGEGLVESLRAEQRPIYSTGRLPVGVAEASFGPLRRLERGRPGTVWAEFDPRIVAYLDEVLASEPGRGWQRVHRDRLLYAVGELAALQGATGEWVSEREPWRRRLDAAGLYGILGALGPVQASGSPEQVLRWTRRGLDLVDARTERLARAQLWYSHGRALQGIDDLQGATEAFEQSWLAHHTRPDDGVGLVLLRLYAKQGRLDDYRRVRRAGWGRDDVPEEVMELDARAGL